MDAEDLEKGDGIWSLDGDYGTVEKVVVVEDVFQPMYNLTVDEAHTYFIADGDWLVHNDGCLKPLISSISVDKRLVREAEKLDGRIQTEADDLVQRYREGNSNPGLGTKNLFGDVFYLRGRNGARIFFRETDNGTMEILGKSNKNNEQRVIDVLKDLYE